MSDEEMRLWQHIDELRDKVDALEKKNEDMQTSWLVFMNLMAKHLENENGKQL